MRRTVVIGVVETVEYGLCDRKWGSYKCASWRITNWKRMENLGCHTIYTVFLMPRERATVENTGS
jgi:hypothetical protein